MLEDEVERAKTQGFIKDLARNSENPDFYTPNSFFPGVLALNPILLYHVRSDGAYSQTIRYISKTR